MVHIVAMKDGEKTKLVEGMIIWLALRQRNPVCRNSVHMVQRSRDCGPQIQSFLSHEFNQFRYTLRGNFCNKTKSIFCSLVVITLYPHGAWNKWQVMGGEREVKGRWRDLADEQRFNFFSTTSTNLEKLSPAWPLRYPTTQTLAPPLLKLPSFQKHVLCLQLKRRDLTVVFSMNMQQDWNHCELGLCILALVSQFYTDTLSWTVYEPEKVM